MQSASGSGNHTYGFLDKQPINGPNYYRLKSMDRDGKFTYSKVVSINTALVAGKGLGIYPNPATDNVVLTHATASAGAIIRLTTIDGKLLVTKMVTQGAVQTSVDVSKLASGQYLASFYNNGVVESKLLIKQ